MKKFNKRKIWISSLLALSLLINVLSASAAEIDNNLESATPETEQSYAESPIVSEDVSKRGENEKHFLCEDGSYIAVAYADAVHEKNEQDEWIEIDNTLALENNRIENNSDNFRISFSETANPSADFSPNAGELLNNSTADASESQLVSMESGEHRLSWSLSATSMLNLSQKEELNRQGILLETQETSSLMAEQMDGFIGAPPAKQLYQHSLSALSEAEIEQTSLSPNPTNHDIITNLKNTSSILYRNALGNDVDLQYTVNPGRIKEDIIINERGTFVSYTMNLDTDGLTAVLNDDNSVSFLDIENQVTFTISAPYMYDSADTESYDIDVEMLQSGNNCTISFTPDSDWLNDNERVYPITIDPETHSTDTTSDFLQDTYVENTISTNYGTAQKLYCGYRNNIKNRTYIKFKKFPTQIAPASSIVGASVVLTFYSGTSTRKPFSLYQITGADWGEYTLHGTNQPTFTSTKLQDNSDNNLTTLTFNNADVKDYVCKYYANVNNNYGFVVCYKNETDNDYNSFYSRENGNGLAPYLSVTYYEPANIENGTYYIRNKKSGHYLDVNNFGGAGTQLMQHTFNGVTNQQWVFQKQTANNTFNGYYRISPGHNKNLYLDVANANATNGTAIQVYTRTESNAQHWTLIDNGDGSYRIMSKASSNRRCITVKDSSTASGALIQQWDYTANTNTNDEWYLERAYNYGYKGFAVYRDLQAPMGLFSDDWHSGLMDEHYATDYLPVIHVTGLSQVVGWISWDEFVANKAFHGVYRPKQVMSDYQRGQVISMARELRGKEIGYILTTQMRATLWPDATWILPEDIVDLRCDGLLEYCYEYYGIRIYGDDIKWDISRSDANNLAHHGIGSITPKTQAENYMIKITSNVPNQE